MALWAVHAQLNTWGQGHSQCHQGVCGKLPAGEPATRNFVGLCGAIGRGRRRGMAAAPGISEMVVSLKTSLTGA